MVNELKPTVPELLDKLVSHGDKRHIAAFFEQEGIKGIQSSQSSCAVAAYLYREAGRAVSVTGRTIEWCEFTPHPDSILCDKVEVCTAVTPPAVTSFIRAFDQGVFPELLEGDPEPLDVEEWM
jgi:hypothetical protein